MNLQITTALSIFAVCAFQPAAAWVVKTSPPSSLPSTRSGRSGNPSVLFAETWFADVTSTGTSTVIPPTATTTTMTTTSISPISLERVKAQILQLGAALDRGQSYNPTSGAYYEDTMAVAKTKIEALVTMGEATASIPQKLEDMEGEWELVLSTVPHGIFRSSPFFLAIQESYEYAENNKMENGEPKANLFFRLHELQTCSWGVSKIGRVAQRIDSAKGYLYSEFDTSIFSLTVIPILGWFKLLPTFGGCVVTASKCQLKEGGRLEMEVDYTTSRKVPGLSGLPLLGDFIWKVNVPVGAIWKLLPWNKGRPATCKVFVKYLDQDFRVVQDIDGEYFVYTRPVVSRLLEI